MVLGYFFLLHLIFFKYHLFTFKYTHLIIFKAQEYLYLTIFEKLMIQVYSKTILSNGIQIHNQSPWFKPMAIHSSKTQFSLAILKTQFSLATSKPNSYWQYQNPIPIGNMKAQFPLATWKPNSYWWHQSPILIGDIKAQFLLATSKPNFHWQYFIKEKRA